MNSTQLTTVHAELAERVKGMRIELDDVHAILKSAKDDLAALRQQNAVQQQIIEDHAKRLEKWDARSWWFVTAIVGMLFALVVGLIVALVKR